MPSYKNPMIVEIKDVTMSEENYYSIQKVQEMVHLHRLLINNGFWRKEMRI